LSEGFHFPTVSPEIASDRTKSKDDVEEKIIRQTESTALK
jgi:hypothetical protein